MKKILWCSDSPIIPTGYAQVTRNIGMRFKRAGFDFNALGFQQWSMPISEVKYQEGWLNFPLFPVLSSGEFYGNQGSIEYWVNNLRPNITMFLLDSFMLRHLVENKLKGNVIERTMDKIKNVTSPWMYFPFDSADVYQGAKEVLEAMDVRIAMSKFAQKLLKDQTGLDSFYIPHGCDTLIYRPLPKDYVEKFKTQMGIQNKFVVGSVFRNQTRKLPSKLLKAYKIFSDRHNDTILLLHTDANDPQGQNLIDLMERIKLDKSKVRFTNMNFISGVTAHDVNVIYNMMDVHALSTTGEGFGLPIIESQAAGIPNVITDYTTSRELIEGHGQLVKVKDFIEGQMNTNRAMVDVEDMANCFDTYYNNRELMQKHGKDARKFTLEHYNWEKVMRMWIELLTFGEIYEQP